MIKNFENKFGKPAECTIILGDYDKENNRKGKEPVINRRIRKIFRNHNLHAMRRANLEYFCC